MPESLSEELFFSLVREIGGKIYIVGGWVRDKVMNRTPQDKDYTLTGISEALFMKRFPQAKRVGNSFPVYLLKIDGCQREVAFARTETKTAPGYTGFSVAFGPEVTIEDDLYRRDTTMNSMAWDVEKKLLIDPYGGSEAIRNKVISATSQHFKDDPMRALRAARQSAQLKFKIDENTLLLMSEAAEELLLEPKERIVAELSKALSSDYPSLFFRALHDANLLSHTFPWIFNLIGQTQPIEYHPEGDAFEHTMSVLDKVANKSSRVEVRFAALLHDIGKSTTDKGKLPLHHGHEKSGLKLLKEINDLMTLPSLWYKCAEFAIKEHMRAPRLKHADKIVDLLLRLSIHPIGHDGFSAIIEADSPEVKVDFLLHYDSYLDAMALVKNLKIPAELSGRQIASWIRERQIEAYKRQFEILKTFDKTS